MRSWTALTYIVATTLLLSVALLSVAAIAEEAQPVAAVEPPAEVAGFDEVGTEAPAPEEAAAAAPEPADPMAEPWAMDAGDPADSVDGFDMLDSPAEPVEVDLETAGGADAPVDPLPVEFADAGADPLALEPADVPSESAEAVDAAASEVDGAGWDGFDESAATPEQMGATPAAPSKPGIVLGPMAVDEEGRIGRIHTVSRGDTLWDISAAYLGTPWVWPAVWQDNEEIENPHRIDPKDRIWITAGEMRVVTESEADQMISAHGDLAAGPAELDPSDESLAGTFDELEPAEYVEGPLAAEDEMMDDELPAAMDELPIAVPLQAKASNDSGFSVRVAEREAMGFVTADVVEAATTIVESPSIRTLLVEGDMIYLGLGDGEVQVGDEYQIFRDIDAVADVEGNVLLGYHVDVLGWAVVREITGDTSIAEIRMSQSDIRRGDRMVPREPVHLNVPIRFSPEGLPGNIVYLPRDRTTMGEGDYVYLNRGTLHGFEVGSAIEIFESGELRKDQATGRKVMTPDHIVGKLVIVAVRPDSSVAFVVRASHELQVGDRVRPARQRLAKN
jgi:nucleoid-associated protein YgaU